MEVSGQLHTLTTLPPAEQSSLWTQQIKFKFLCDLHKGYTLSFAVFIR